MTTFPTAWLEAQVACQVPSFKGNNARGGSPLEKLALTDPEIWAFKQSSVTLAESATGQPALTVKEPPSVVSAGISRVGVQVASRASRAELEAAAELDITVNLTD